MELLSKSKSRSPGVNLQSHSPVVTIQESLFRLYSSRVTLRESLFSEQITSKKQHTLVQYK